MKITFITGFPGAGKSTYALGTGCPVTYDLDRLADAMDYKRGTLVARRVASRLLPAIINAAELEGVPHIQLIRVTPSDQEMHLARRHSLEIVEVRRSVEKCAECRPDISKEAWARIALIHANFLKSNSHRVVAIPEERW